jgi:hypothetical protein
MGNDNTVRAVFVAGNKMGGDSTGMEAGGNAQFLKLLLIKQWLLEM